MLHKSGWENRAAFIHSPAKKILKRYRYRRDAA
jgi:hypothetical protein